MTEGEWLASADPAVMVEFLGDDGTRSGCARVSERKLRLWVGACRMCVPPALAQWSNKMKTTAEMERAVHDWCLRATWTEECPLALRAALLRDLAGNPFADRTWLIHRCPKCLQEGRWHWRGSDDAPGRWPYCPDCGVEMRHRRDLWLAPTVLSLARAAYEQSLPGREVGCEKCQGPLKERVDELMAGGPFGDGIGPCNASWHINQEFGTRLTPEEVHAVWQKRKPWFKGRCDCHVEDGFLDPERLAVLSDALEEAGCQEAAILEHLRSPGPHAAGCWCVDTLLGLE